MSSSSRPSVTISLRRDLGLLDVTMIGVGAMIGTSIFVLVGVVMNEIAAGVLIVFALNGIATIFTAATYAELGSSFPEAGGGYLWAKKALPHPSGFMSGWMSWFGHTVACSYYSLGFGYAMVALVNLFEIDLMGISDAMLVKLFAVFVMIFFIGVNYAGVGATGRAGTLVTLIQIMIIAFFVSFAVIYALDMKGVDIADNFTPIFPEDSNLSELFMAMGFTFIAFEGYEIVVQCGEEVREPRKNIPRAIFISVAFACVLYLCVAFASMANFGPSDSKWDDIMYPNGENAVINIAGEIIPFVGAPLMIFGAMLSAMAALNATVFSSSRVSFAMGRDGSLPRMFGIIHRARRIPHNAIIVTGVIMLSMALFFPLDVVVASTSIMFLLLFALANLASIRLRNRLTEFDVGYRTPLFPLFPVVGATLSIGIALYLWWFIPEAWYVAGVWLMIGIVLSVFARPAEEAVSIAEQKRIPQRPLTKAEIQRYRVYLALGDMGDLRLVESAGIFARYFKGDLTLNTIVEVPRTTPLEAISRDFIDEVSTSLRKAAKIAPTTVRVRPIVSVSYDVAGSILDQARHDAANLLVLGWKGTRRRGGTILGRNLDRVVREAPCDVAIIKTKRLSKSIENILLINGGYYETRKALLMALPIAKEYGARVVILSPITADDQIELVRGNAERLQRMCERIEVQSEVKIVHSKSFVNTVLQHAPESDLIVMGTGPQSAFEMTMFGAAYDRIIRSVEIPVMIIKTSKVPKGRAVTLAS